MVWGLLAGLAIGVIGKFVMRRNDPGGVIVTVLLGLGGAALAMYLGRLGGWYKYGEAWSVAGSAIGAVLMLGAYRFTFNKAGHKVRTAPGSSI